MDNDEESEEPHSPEKAATLHAHRLDHNPSKLPAFRYVDLKSAPLGISLLLPTDSETANAADATKQGIPVTSTGDDFLITTASVPLSSYAPAKRPSTSPGGSVVGTYFPLSPPHSASTLVSRLQQQDKRARRGPASHNNNGMLNATGLSPALSIQQSFAVDSPRTPNTSTTEWALAQQQLAFQSLNTPITPVTPIDNAKEISSTQNPRGATQSLDESTTSKPLIPPIRSFRSSATRASLEMNARAYYQVPAQGDDQEFDRDRTLRALEGYSDDDRNGQNLRPLGHDDQRQDESTTEDLFLNLARDDFDHRMNNGEGEKYSHTERRRSRIALPNSRQSLSLGDITYQQSPIQSKPRRGSDLQGTSPITPRESITQNLQGDRKSYPAPGPSRIAPISSIRPVTDIARSRYTPNFRSFPSTPRAESVISSGGRRSSIPDSNGNITSRPHANRPPLSFATARIYNSSPLVARNKEIDDGSETPRIAEGTESTTSTTAPSTVWDELDDLKSRIRKLELTGKLPATSGAAVSHASGERPPTATTTITTMSTSPKRGRGLSISPVDSNTLGPAAGEPHPLLHSALAKAKPLLNADIYKALETTAQDALAIATMTGSIGPNGIISSAQSVLGTGNSIVADRQLRRKADSLCRSLTELCLAISEVRPEQTQQPTSQALIRPGSRDRDLQNGTLDPAPRSGDGLARMKSSPRALSRLEARRSSLLATTTLPSPRYTPSEVSTPTQSTMASRRTSVLLRSRRAGTEDPEEDEGRFRAPSRATTEIGRTRTAPREYTSQQPLPELRAPSVQSTLPLRRQHNSSALNANLSRTQTLPTSNSSGRRFLDRQTPEREISNNTVISKLAEERGQRTVNTGIGTAFEGRGLGRSGSLNKERRLRPQLRERVDTDMTQVPISGYQ